MTTTLVFIHDKGESSQARSFRVTEINPCASFDTDEVENTYSYDLTDHSLTIMSLLGDQEQTWIRRKIRKEIQLWCVVENWTGVLASDLLTIANAVFISQHCKVCYHMSGYNKTSVGYWQEY